MPARTELSDRIAAELKSRGFKFLGSVTIYAFMQSVGLVNDHTRFCSATRSSPARWGRNKWYNIDIGNKRRMNTMELNGPKEDLLSI